MVAENKTRQKKKPQIFLVNIDVNMLNRILANGIEQLYRKIIHYDQVRFILKT